MLYSCTHMATVGFKGLIKYSSFPKIRIRVSINHQCDDECSSLQSSFINIITMDVTNRHVIRGIKALAELTMT